MAFHSCSLIVHHILREKYLFLVCFSIICFNFVFLSRQGFFDRKFFNFSKSHDENFSNNLKNDSVNDDLYEGINWSDIRPHVYSKRVDLRLVVITMNRPRYLSRLLRSLEKLEMDGDEMAVEIWIDRTKNPNKTLDEKTLDVCERFSTRNNFTTIHVHPHHVGLYYQWIFTYSSDHLKEGEDEILLILEDDLIISKFSYRFLKAVHKHFHDLPYYMGTTLRNMDKVHPKYDRVPGLDSVFMHRTFSTHAFSPKLEVWKKFQGWYISHYKIQNFKPYVPNILPTVWYKVKEGKNKSLSMWSQWMLYYCYIEQLFTVYPNPKLNYGEFFENTCFCEETQAIGLNFFKERFSSCYLIDKWSEDFVLFPKRVKKFEWNGSLYSS